MNFKWYKFLITEERNFFIANIMKIYNSLDHIITDNDTANILDRVPPPSFADFLKDNDLIPIFKTYEIDDLIGSGRMGMAFSLKDPHENYVLKIEMHHFNKDKPGQKRHGVDYPQQIATKQELGKYDPKQIQVLESEVVEGGMIDTDSYAWAVDFYLSVMSRVQTSGYAGRGSKNKWSGLYKDDPRYEGGMSIKDAMKDFAFSKAPAFLSMAVENSANSNPDLKNFIRDEIQYSKFGASLPRDKNVYSKIADVLYNKILIQDGKGIANFLYNTFQDQFQYLSKEQFVDLCREFYERLADAKRSGKAFADFHGGNVGIGPKGFASFDV